ncbi:MAG: endonuclease MutS2 [Clostridia bacterium]|nr:endonuclease MutS2 [Clostridia bacterium]
MNNKTLTILEFDKILKKVSEYATGSKTKERVLGLKPKTDIDDVKYLLDETDQAVVLLLKFSAPPSCGLENQDELIKRAMADGTLSIKELLSICTLLRVSRAYHEYGEDIQEYEIINSYIENIYSYESLEKEIDSSILNEETLSDAASSELLKIRRSKMQFDAKIKSTLNSYISSEQYAKFLQEPIVTTRGGRYVVPVKSEYKANIKGIVHDTSSTGATLFVEPASVVEFNNNIRELELEELREVERILKELSKKIALIGDSLLENIKYIAKLDVAFAKAKYAVDINAMKPKVNNDGVVKMRKARHPLIDKTEVVAIDIYIGESFDTLVITGPNTGGKTVSLKTVGLLTLMAQAGLLIPVADGSAISVFENVYADIGDEQSIEQSLSTFSSHMTTIVEIVNNVSPGSLVLFDELGAGTDPTEGAALAIAILETVRKRGAKTVATTHYSEIKLYAMSSERIENASCEFDVKTLRPTYNLNIGTPGKSNAFAISKRIGLDESIINEAESYISRDNIKFEDILSDLEHSRMTAQRELNKATRLKKDAAEYKQSAKHEKNKLEKEKDKLLEKAAYDAEKIISDTQKQVDEMIAEIINLKKQNNDDEALKQLEKFRKELKKKKDSVRRRNNQQVKEVKGQIPKNVIPGTVVFVTDTNSNGTVLAAPDKKGNVQVQTGILKISVPLASLRIAEENESENIAKAYVSTKEFVSKAATISPQIDVRGMYAQEAVDKVDKFLDDASVANLPQITVVHGKGTGALKSAIHELLKGHHAVKDFRLGVYGEGEAGVTVVKMK